VVIKCNVKRNFSNFIGVYKTDSGSVSTVLLMTSDKQIKCILYMDVCSMYDKRTSSHLTNSRVAG